MSTKILPINKSLENGLKTYMFNDHGVTFVRVTCETYQKHAKSYIVPFDTLIYWYPLYFYYSWKYDFNKDKIYLHSFKEAPKGLKGFLINNPQYLDKCINIESKNSVEKNNLVYQDNIELMSQFKEMGLTTFIEKFNKKQVVDNFIKLEKILEGVWISAYKTSLNDSNNYEKLSDIKELTRDRQIYLSKFLTDDDKRLMIRVGCAEVMTMKMSDALRSKEIEQG